MADTKARPFKKFYCDDRDIFRLPGTALKIWLYHYTREGKDRKSWPTVETLCEELDINRDTLFRWREYLVAHGWLEKVGDHRRLDGEFSVPEYKVRKGTVTEKIVDGHPDKRKANRVRKNQTRTGPKKSYATDPKISDTDRSEKIRHEVDSGLLDSGEVHSGLLEKSKSKASPVSFESRKSKATPKTKQAR